MPIQKKSNKILRCENDIRKEKKLSAESALYVACTTEARSYKKSEIPKAAKGTYVATIL